MSHIARAKPKGAASGPPTKATWMTMAMTAAMTAATHSRSTTGQAAARFQERSGPAGTSSSSGTNMGTKVRL